MTMTDVRLPADKWLDRVQGLLAKADSTPFPEEAEALVAKAQELMTRHQIDEAMLAANSPTPSDPIVNENIQVPFPYAAPKANLLHRVAKANGCSTVQHHRGRCSSAKYLTVNLTGFRSEVEAVKMLYARLVAFANTEMQRTEVPSWDNTRAFRNSFLYGFANRIGDRLDQAQRDAVTSHETETGSTGTALVLIDKKAAVDADVKERYGRLVTLRRTDSSASGRNAGRNSADQARLNGGDLGRGRSELSA